MMNKANETVAAIKGGKNVAVEELFDLINVFKLTTLSVCDENSVNLLDMYVNHFKAYSDVFEFSQEHKEYGKYIVKQLDVVFSESRYEEEIDCVFITCQLADNKTLKFTVFYVSEDFETYKSDDYYEISLEGLQEFLESTLGEDNEYNCYSVRIVDKFCINLVMVPERTYINTLDDSDRRLHISDSTNMFEISVMDGCSNAFYRKDNDSSVEIIVKPYGHPFMEIRMLFFKRSE